MKKIIAIVVVCIMVLAISIGIVLASQRHISLVVGSNIAKVDGENIKLDVPAQIVNGRTMVPLRFIADAFGAQTKWDAQTKTIDIVKNDSEISSTITTSQIEIRPIASKEVSTDSRTIRLSKRYLKVTVLTIIKSESGNLLWAINDSSGNVKQLEFVWQGKDKVQKNSIIYDGKDREYLNLSFLFTDVDFIQATTEESDYPDFKK
jgi:hypothetical protein